MARKKTYDAVVVGGGYAGLAAALWLGRFQRSVLVVSSGAARNGRSHVLHGYPGFDGADPAELLGRIRDEAAGYGADFVEAKAKNIRKSGASFAVETDAGNYAGRRLLVATGKTDTTPDIPNFDAFEGVSAWHCPACDGQEYTGRRIVVIGWGEHIADYTREFLSYTKHIMLLTHGHGDEVSDEARRVLSTAKIPVIDTPITGLNATPDSNSRIKSVTTQDGTELPADAIFYNIRLTARLDLLTGLGCETEDDAVIVNRQQETCVPGVYAAGDIAPLEELAVVACATGAVAANNIHTSLQKY